MPSLTELTTAVGQGAASALAILVVALMAYVAVRSDLATETGRA
jgi:hypothetical protein